MNFSEQALTIFAGAATLVVFILFLLFLWWLTESQSRSKFKRVLQFIVTTSALVGLTIAASWYLGLYIMGHIQ